MRQVTVQAYVLLRRAPVSEHYTSGRALDLQPTAGIRPCSGGERLIPYSSSSSIIHASPQPLPAPLSRAAVCLRAWCTCQVTPLNRQQPRSGVLHRVPSTPPTQKGPPSPHDVPCWSAAINSTQRRSPQTSLLQAYSDSDRRVLKLTPQRPRSRKNEPYLINRERAVRYDVVQVP